MSARLCHFLWRTGRDQLPAVTASSRTEVHNVVRTGHHVEVVLHIDDGVALFNEGVKRLQQLGHVVEMGPVVGSSKMQMVWPARSPLARKAPSLMRWASPPLGWRRSVRA